LAICTWLIGHRYSQEPRNAERSILIHESKETIDIMTIVANTCFCRIKRHRSKISVLLRSMPWCLHWPLLCVIVSQKPESVHRLLHSDAQIAMELVVQANLRSRAIAFEVEINSPYPGLVKIGQFHHDGVDDVLVDDKEDVSKHSFGDAPSIGVEELIVPSRLCSAVPYPPETRPKHVKIPHSLTFGIVFGFVFRPNICDIWPVAMSLTLSRRWKEYHLPP
jgi:hypothetical protein